VYGLYDWHDRSTPERDRFMEFLERVVVRRLAIPRSFVRHRRRNVFIHSHHRSFTPPFLAVHGSNDRLIPVGEARTFVDRMRSVSDSAVGYIELPGVGHGFDLIDGGRTAPVVAAIGRFLNHVYRERRLGTVTSAI
jgi:acetyl esterase/lipase